MVDYIAEYLRDICSIGKEMVDYIADYLRDIRSRRVFPGVSPGYMRKLIPEVAPQEPEDWETIFADIERVIMPGMTHWQSPHMHAYFPALNSFPSLLGDMLADAINCIGFTWASGPACTELETIVMDWLGKLIGLPSVFLHSNEQTMGGGVIQTTASEATFVCLLAARTEVITRYKTVHPDLEDAEINTRLVAYCSDQAHSSVEKAGLVGLVKTRFLPSDDNLSLRGETLLAAVELDKQKGLIPFYLCATLGTTGACAFDNLVELGPICDRERIWMHIDAAYAGTAFICPEYRTYMAGIEHAQSFAFNPSKWMMVNFDCTAMWVKNSGALHRTFNVDPLYLKHANSGAAIDYMHWQVPLSRRFRSLKLWFVIRNFGVLGLQNHVREGVRLAMLFENLVQQDRRFDIAAKRILGLVVFRLKGENDLTETLLKTLNSSGKVHMVPASLKDRYVIRFTVTSQYTTDDDIIRDWEIIREAASEILEDVLVNKNDNQNLSSDEPETEPVNILPHSPPSKIILKRLPSIKRQDFGLSLLLSNVPHSPKFINGSFAAIFDNNDVRSEYVRHLSLGGSRRSIPMSPRRKLKDYRQQQSFDISHLTSRCFDFRSFKQGSLDSKIEEIFDVSPEPAEKETEGKKNGGYAKDNGKDNLENDRKKNGENNAKSNNHEHNQRESNNRESNNRESNNRESNNRGSNNRESSNRDTGNQNGHNEKYGKEGENDVTGDIANLSEMKIPNMSGGDKLNEKVQSEQKVVGQVNGEKEKVEVDIKGKNYSENSAGIICKTCGRSFED